MNKSILQKSSKNYLFSVISIVSTTLIGFIATPIIIKYVSESKYGIYQLILQFLGYLSLSDFGLSTSSCSLLSESWRLQDRKHVIRTIKKILKEYLKITPLTITLIISLYFIFTKYSLKSTDPNIIYPFLIMSASALLIPLNVFKDFLNSSESSHLISKTNTIQLIGMSLLNILFSYKGYSLMGLAISFILMIGLSQAALFLISYYKITQLPITHQPFEIQTKSLWIMNFHSLLQNLFGKLSFASDTIILSFFAPTYMVTRFIVNQRLSRIVESFTNNIGSSSWASIAANKSSPEISNSINFFNKLIALVAISSLSALGMHNKAFITLWLGQELYISDLFTWIAFANIFVFGILSFWGWIFVGFGKHTLLTKTIAISGLINIGTSIIITKYYGAVGPVLGTFIGFYGFYLWHAAYLMKKELQISVMSFIVRLIGTIIGVGIAITLLKQFTLVHSHSWLGLLINLSFTFIITFTISLLIFFSKEELLKLTTFMRKK